MKLNTLLYANITLIVAIQASALLLGLQAGGVIACLLMATLLTLQHKTFEIIPQSDLMYESQQYL